MTTFYKRKLYKYRGESLYDFYCRKFHAFMAEFGKWALFVVLVLIIFGEVSWRM